jgi:hypothetical protein
MRCDVLPVVTLEPKAGSMLTFFCTENRHQQRERRHHLPEVSKPYVNGG